MHGASIVDRPVVSFKYEAISVYITRVICRMEVDVRGFVPLGPRSRYAPTFFFFFFRIYSIVLSHANMQSIS